MPVPLNSRTSSSSFRWVSSRPASSSFQRSSCAKYACKAYQIFLAYKPFSHRRADMKDHSTFSCLLYRQVWQSTAG